MNKFISKIFILIFPYVLIPLLVLNLSGELLPIRDVVSLSAIDSNPILYGPAYSDQMVRFKVLSTIEKHPDVLALGTSRVMQFRENFFKDNIKFYNAGGGIIQIDELSMFLKQIPMETSPKIIIVGLDQYFFNEAWTKSLVLHPSYDERLLKDLPAIDVVQTSMVTVWQDLFKGKFSKRSILASSGESGLIGLNAIENHNGFRNDGSYLYGKFISDPGNPQNEDYSYRDTFARITNGDQRFEYGKNLSPAALTDLGVFLDECDRRGIHVVGFLPPYASAVYQKMNSMPAQYAYMHKIMPTLTPMFAKHGFTLLDFSNLATIGATDAETIDGFHGSEKAYLRIFMLMAKKDSVLSQFSANLDYLQMKLDKTKNDFTVFGE